MTKKRLRNLIQGEFSFDKVEYIYANGKFIVNAIIWSETSMSIQQAEKFARCVGIKENLKTHLITEDEYKIFFPEGLSEKIWLSGENAKSNKGKLLEKGRYIDIGIIIVIDII